MGYTLLTMVALLLTLLLNVFGKRILDLLQLHDLRLYLPLSGLLKHMHLYSLVLLTVFFRRALSLPSNRRERFLYVLPGALAAAAAWLGFFCGVFRLRQSLNHYSALYGSLSTILLTMIWLYVCLSILFYGAYLNQLLSRVWKRRGRSRRAAAGAGCSLGCI